MLRKKLRMVVMDVFKSYRKILIGARFARGRLQPCRFG
jgi:hypothetical protein